MRRTVRHAIVLLSVPVIMLPIILGASGALEQQRKELWFQMRREHLRSLARDRQRAADRRVMELSAASGPIALLTAARPAPRVRPSRP